MIAVSACLVGKNTKYNGQNNYNQAVIDYLKDKEYIIFCPEVLGGLPIPRLPSERQKDKVINSNNIDVTNNFIIGAKKALDIIRNNHVETIIVKSNSPSCGYKSIYDGTFKGHLITGNGVFVDMVLKEKINILTELDIEKISLKK